jgi:hypothetical protein
MAGWGLGARPVGPVLGDHLVLVGELGAVAQYLLSLTQVAGAGEAPGPAAWAQLRADAEGERGDQAPVGGQEALHGSVRLPQRLPAVRVHQPIWRVDRAVAGPVRVRARRQVTELIGPVAVAESEDRSGREGADRARRLLATEHPWVVAELVHNRHKQGPLGGEQVDQGMVGGETDCLALGILAALGGRAAPHVTEPGADGQVVVSCPGVVHGGVQDMDRAGRHRGPEAGAADGLQGSLIPGDDSRTAHSSLLHQARRDRGATLGRTARVQGHSNAVCRPRRTGDEHSRWRLAGNGHGRAALLKELGNPLEPSARNYGRRL